MTQDKIEVEISSNQADQTQRKSRNPFKKKDADQQKQQAQSGGDEQIHDVREPDLKFHDAFTIYKIIGINWIIILLGTIGAMGSGVIPIR